jgi:hypothetical protein
MIMENFWWNDDWQRKPKYSEKTCPSATLSTTNPKCSAWARTRTAAMGSQLHVKIKYEVTISVYLVYFLMPIKYYSNTSRLKNHTTTPPKVTILKLRKKTNMSQQYTMKYGSPVIKKVAFNNGSH